ncbi:hypothetical protein MTO96_008723 [Rhipicephalus appendiculatus]
MSTQEDRPHPLSPSPRKGATASLFGDHLLPPLPHSDLEFASQQPLAPSVLPLIPVPIEETPPRPVPGSRSVSSVARLCVRSCGSSQSGLISYFSCFFPLRCRPPSQKPSGDGASQETRLRQVSDVRLRLDLVEIRSWRRRAPSRTSSLPVVLLRPGLDLPSLRGTVRRTSGLFAQPALSRTFTERHSDTLLRAPGVPGFLRPGIPSTVGAGLKEGPNMCTLNVRLL